MLDLLEELRNIIARVDAAGLPYALCGGLAMAVHGNPRATVDIDLLVLVEGKITVVSRDGLIALKSLRGSGLDQDDIKHLRGETE